MLRQLQTATATGVTEGGSQSVTQTTSSSPAAPFTPEEIAHAIAELEKERSLQESAQNPTTQISEILEQLHLDLPAAEVSARITRERNALLRQSAIKRRRMVLISTITALCCVSIAVAFWVLGNRPVEAQTQAVQVATPVFAERVDVQTLPPSQILITDYNHGVETRMTLAEVPEGKRVTISADQLKQMIDLRQIGPLTDFTSENKWKVFRKAGVWYLSAFTDVQQSRGALLAAPTVLLQNVQSTDSGTLAPLPVSIPLNAFAVTGSDHIPNTPYHTLNVRLKEIDKLQFKK